MEGGDDRCQRSTDCSKMHLSEVCFTHSAAVLRADEWWRSLAAVGLYDQTLSAPVDDEGRHSIGSEMV